MNKLLLIAIVGFTAQLVDGALGMAYGATTTSLLLAFGLTGAIASFTVHTAELGTSFASGASHIRFGNVDWRTVSWIALPGAIGAFIGATILSLLLSDTISKVPMAVILIGLGIFVFVRFVVAKTAKPRLRPVPAGGLMGLGVIAGFVDAISGGGWGPIATSTLVSSGRLEPRKVIGSVNTAEFVVTLSAFTAFMIFKGPKALEWWTVAVLLGAGVLAAPLAAWLVRVLPIRVTGAAVGGLIVITNTRTLAEFARLPTEVLWVLYLSITALWITAIVIAVRKSRQDRAREPEGEPALEFEPAMKSASAT